MADIILAFVVMVLALALVALYQKVGKIQPFAPGETWPLAGRQAGADLSSILEQARPFTGVLLVVASGYDPRALIFSASLVAEDHGVAVAVLTPDNGLLTASALRGAEAIPLSAATLAALGARQLPLALYVREDRLLDATGVVESPSAIATRFRFVLPTIDSVPTGGGL